MIINKTNIDAVSIGFKTIFNNAFKEISSDFDKIAMTVNSSAKAETYAWLGKTTKFKEWLGDRVIQNLEAHDYTIKNKSFENTVGVDRDDIEDDSYGVYNPMIAQLGADAKSHPDELIFNLLKNGFDSKCYDGQYFFDADHKVINATGEEVSVSNSGGGSGTSWFLLSAEGPIKPLIFQKRRDYQFVSKTNVNDDNVFHQKQFLYGVDARVNAGYGLWQLAYGSKQTLDATNYAAARSALMGMKGDNGKPLNIKPSILVVPPSLEGKALEILNAERNSSGATNVYRNTAKLLVTSWLA